MGLIAVVGGGCLEGDAGRRHSGLEQFELFFERLQSSVEPGFCRHVVHGLGVCILQVPEGSGGGMPREDLDPGDFYSAAP